MKIRMFLPSFTRGEALNQAIGSIAMARTRARGCEVDLVAGDSGASGATAEVLEQWRATETWIHALPWNGPVPRGRDLLDRVVRFPDHDFDYGWFLGDGDWMTDSRAFLSVTAAIAESRELPPALVHACQARRAQPGDHRILSGCTEDLCNALGWHDLLGNLSSLVISRDTLARMLASQQWDLPTPSALRAAEALLEAGYGRPLLVLGAGLVDTQEAEPATGVPRALLEGEDGDWGFIPGLLALQARGILQKPLWTSFFRCGTGTFRDRFSAELLSLADREGVPDEVIADKLKLLGRLGLLLGRPEDRKLFEDWREGFRRDVVATREASRQRQARRRAAERPPESPLLLPPSPVPAAPPLTPPACKCCASRTRWIGALDFNASCMDRDGRVFPVSPELVPYYACEHCGFVFTTFCDDWRREDFQQRIYNGDYALADPDPGLHRGIRATVSYRNGQELARLLEGSAGRIRLLDFGAGGKPGRMGQALIDAGFEVDSYEPYLAEDALEQGLRGRYDVICAMEVFEHCHDLEQVLSIIDQRLAERGLLYFSTCLHPYPTPDTVLDSWYIAPRNGHISIFTHRAITLLFRRIGIHILHHAFGWIGLRQLPDFPNAFFPGTTGRPLEAAADRVTGT